MKGKRAGGKAPDPSDQEGGGNKEHARARFRTGDWRRGGNSACGRQSEQRDRCELLAWKNVLVGLWERGGGLKDGGGGSKLRKA